MEQPYAAGMLANMRAGRDDSVISTLRIDRDTHAMTKAANGYSYAGASGSDIGRVRARIAEASGRVSGWRAEWVRGR